MHTFLILLIFQLCTRSLPAKTLPALPRLVIAAYSRLILHITYMLLILHWDLLCTEAFLTLLRLQHCAQPPSYTDALPTSHDV